MSLQKTEGAPPSAERLPEKPMTIIAIAMLQPATVPVAIERQEYLARAA